MNSAPIAGRLHVHADVKAPNTLLSQRTSRQTFHLGKSHLEFDFEFQQIELDGPEPALRFENKEQIGRSGLKAISCRIE